MSSTVRRAACLMTAAAFLLSGCAAKATTDANTAPLPITTTPEGAPTGPLATTAHPDAVAARDASFGVVLPADWQNLTGSKPSTVLSLRAKKPSHEVYQAFSVVRSTVKNLPGLSNLVEQGMVAQRQKGATVTKIADRSIGGVPASGYSTSRTVEDHTVIQTQFYVVREDSVWILTSTSEAADKAVQEKIADAILASWSWGNPGNTASTGTGSAPPTGGAAPSGTATNGASSPASPSTTPSTVPAGTPTVTTGTPSPSN